MSNIKAKITQIRIVREIDTDGETDLDDESRYSGLPADEIAKYMAEDTKRLEAFHNNEWWYYGVRAEASISFEFIEEQVSMEGSTIGTAGVWGIESDSEDSFFDEIGGEEYAQLSELLQALGFTEADVLAAPLKKVSQ